MLEAFLDSSQGGREEAMQVYTYVSCILALAYLTELLSSGSGGVHTAL